MIVCNKCGVVDDYKTEMKANNKVAYCNACGSFIKNIPYSEPTLHFGKFKGTRIIDFTTPQMANYLKWVIDNVENLPLNIKLAIIKQLGLNERDYV